MKAIALFLCLAATAASTRAADVNTSAAPPVTIDDPGGPPSPLGQCSNTCTTTSSCSKKCYDDGDPSTCGNFGRCKSCASHCTSGVRCSEPACMQDGVLTSCQATGRQCQSCSASICDGTPLRCGDGQRCSVPVHNGYLYPTCESWASNTGDRDLDQVPEALELALARRFFPALNMRFPLPPAGCVGPYPYADACNYFNDDSYGQFYATTLSFEYGGGATHLPFTVRPYKDTTPECDAEFECLEIAYTLLYNNDYGDAGDSGHPGDSESVAVLVSRNVSNPRRGLFTSHPWPEARVNPDHWAFIKVFAAAHMCAGGQPTFYDDLDGRIYTRIANLQGPGSMLDSDYEPLGTTPYAGLPLWVAEFKNATYFSQHRCNTGNSYFDDCSTDRRWLTLSQYNAAQDDLLNAGASRCHANFPATIQGPSLAPPLMGPYSAFPSGPYAIWGGAPFGESSPLVHKLKEGTFKWDEYDVVCH